MLWLRALGSLCLSGNSIVSPRPALNAGANLFGLYLIFHEPTSIRDSTIILLDYKRSLISRVLCKSIREFKVRELLMCCTLASTFSVPLMVPS